MFVASLQSGSNGNSIYVEAGGVRLLIDAGISGVQAERRLAEFGRDIRAVDALLISHDHADHVGCAGVYHRKFGLPVYATGQTLAAARAWQRLGRIDDVRYFVSGDTLRFDGVTVETIRTPHDCADGVGFVIDDGRQRLGVLTDLGHVFSDLAAVMATLDAVVLESNYDPVMLANGPYTWPLKQRIQGPAGHLSNAEAAELLAGAAAQRLRWACLGHLSEQNNTPELAMRAHREALGPHFPLELASRWRAAGPWEL